MSQTAVMVRVSGNLIPEVFCSVPDEEDAARICEDYGYDFTEDSFTDSYLLEYEWIEIGEGESGTDEFIDDETLLAIYDAYDYEKTLKDLYGLDVETVQDGTIEVLRE